MWIFVKNTKISRRIKEEKEGENMHSRQEMILWCEIIGSVTCLKSGASSLFVCQCPAKCGFWAVTIAILIGSFVQIFELIPAISLIWKQKSYFQFFFSSF